MQSYRYNDRVYSIKNCTTQDVPSHFERVFSYWAIEDHKDQLVRMQEAVYCGTAYKLVDKTGETVAFNYYEQISEQEVVGIAMWWKTISLFSIYCYWFKTKTFNKSVFVQPHSMNPVPLEFIVDEQSIRDYWLEGTPLLIDIHSNKFMRIIRLYEELGIEEILNG